MIEPTQPVNPYENNPYEKTVYGGIPDIPPPPPKQKKLSTRVIAMLVMMVLLVVGSVTGTYLYAKSTIQQHTSLRSVVKLTPTLHVAAPTPTTHTVTPTATVYPYGARAILQDFIDAGLSVGQPVEATLAGYPHKAERGAYKWDMYGSEMSLSVYATTQEAQDNGYYAEVQSGYQPASYNTNVSYIYYGPCLLVYSPTHVGPGDVENYRNVMQRLSLIHI